MTIPIHQEKDIPRTAGTEKCCFCRKTTSTWSNDRDVACCPDCAKTHSVSQLPTKKQWVDEEIWIYLSERRFCNTFRDYVFANGMTFDQMQEKNITLSPYPFSARSINKTQPGVKS